MKPCVFHTGNTRRARVAAMLAQAVRRRLKPDRHVVTSESTGGGGGWGAGRSGSPGAWPDWLRASAIGAPGAKRAVRLR